MDDVDVKFRHVVEMAVRVQHVQGCTITRERGLLTHAFAQFASTGAIDHCISARQLSLLFSEWTVSCALESNGAGTQPTCCVQNVTHTCRARQHAKCRV